MRVLWTSDPVLGYGKMECLTGFRVLGLGFRVQGSGFRVQGLRVYTATRGNRPKKTSREGGVLASQARSDAV